MPRYSRRPLGAGTQSGASSAAVTANTAAIAALGVSQAAQDSLISAGVTQAELALLQADNDAQDPFVSFIRQADGSIDWEKESGTTGTIAPPATPQATPQAGQIPEVDETGADLGTTATVRMVRPTDGSPSYAEFEDSNGEMTDA